MTANTRPIIVTMGDPNGVGPEVVLRTLPCLNPAQQARLLVVGDPEYMARLSLDLNLGELPPLQFAAPGSFSYPPRWGVVSREAGRFAVACLAKALEEIQRHNGGLLVTAPIHKGAARLAGFDHPGQTEFIASYFPGHSAAMGFFSGPLKIVLVTVHVTLSEVANRLSCEEIERCGQLLFEALRESGIESPRIAVAGLNPHASEAGQFGIEEEQIVEPALRRLRDRAGSRAFSGPFPPDSLFHRAAQGEFDGVVALYHDQGLIPVKLLAFHSAVNVTLGLPVIRTSPCHGTAFDIAGRGCADPRSMQEAFRWGIRLSETRGRGG